MSLVTCSQCGGNGFLANPEGNLSCPTCGGAGFWITVETGSTYRYELAPSLRPDAEHELAVHHQICLLIAYAGFSALGLGTVLNILSNGLAGPFLPSPLTALSSIGGLASMWGATYLSSYATSQKSLYDVSPPEKVISVAAYATKQLRHVLYRATTLARDLNRETVTPDLILLALFEEPRIAGMIARLEQSPQALRESLLTLIPRGQAAIQPQYYLTAEIRQYVAEAIQVALDTQVPYLEVEDLLLALCGNESQYGQWLTSQGITYERLYAITRWYAQEEAMRHRFSVWRTHGRQRPKGYMNRAWTALPTPFLDQFSQDITAQASSGQLPVVTVRSKEINRVIEALGRTERNSVILVGEPGVGKQAILGAVAERMVEEDVPEVLLDKRLLMVDLGSLLLSAESPQQGMQRAMQEIDQAGNVIVAIPDVKLLVGDSAMDAASLLAGGLSQGSLQLMSTATPSDYHRFIESNPSLSALLEAVFVEPLEPGPALEVLEQEAPRIEARQGVLLTYPALAKAVELAHRYTPEQPLPDSAITLLDQAASGVALRKQTWVQAADIIEAMEKKTNIPISQANEQETTRLLNLENSLAEKVIGQPEAVREVAQAIKRSRAGLHQTNRPISSFLFIGPTGVGKTETAKAIAEVFFGSPESMIRLDMSEYQDPASVYRLIGAPATSANDYTEGGSLTTPVREHPFSLILLDELEKAHRDVLNLFLQLLDDGRLTENTGRTIHYRNCIIVATSNAGAPEIVQMLANGTPPDQLRTQTMQLLQGHFAPEFINRFDAIVPFHSLRLEDIERIATIMLAEVIESAKAQDLIISFDQSVTQLLAQIGFDPVYGARPMRRAIQETVESKLADMILRQAIPHNQPTVITAAMLQ